MSEITSSKFLASRQRLAIAGLLAVCLASCGSKKLVTEDYVTGFRIGQLASVSQALSLGKITGEEACNTLKNGIDALNPRAELVKPEAFDGCIDGFEAGVSGKVPKVGDKR